MTNDERMTKVEKVATAGVRHSGFVIDSSFVIRLPHRSRAKAGHSSFTAWSAFTLIELIVVVTVITILAGLVLSTAGYARKKGARARAETEIAAMSAACESYKADNSVYPRDNTTNQYTDTLDARQNFDATQAVYQHASFYLYTQLSGDSTGNRSPTGKSYMAFKPNMLLPPSGTGTVTAIADPFGNSYGYSTANQADPNKGYNPTFDLWSTAGLAPSPTPSPPATQQNLWIKNW
jgi:prepilin-type N-terminal cleavage/methylation domain-containing protein